MRCMQQYASCLYSLGKLKECVAVLEEMIELNTNDNQGVRDMLLLYLIELDERVKFKKYEKIFKDDDMALSLFNRDLFVYKTEGATENANRQLQKALKQNKFVASKILFKKPINVRADYYSTGDENEADYYASFAQQIWQSTSGAILWLMANSGKNNFKNLNL